ncbi:uncharacterized protein A4U43_C01F34910 [Asparagus officinalis]|uniref:DUF4283 domain-containing protein n=1 Tax=Asparagus officinalis TaxID=4686 RepID=A0A5P1FVZ0_ASPOF|nr:uncharacterized protein A4U43_C01F34910 [Asparagus officinalis]
MSRTNPIQIPESALLKEEELSSYLVFKIIAEEVTSLSELQRELPILWKCESTCIISEYYGDNDIFLAKFEEKSEVDRIVEGAPWVLQGNLVSVQKCRPYRSPHDYPFFTSPFYVRLYNLQKHQSPSPELLGSLKRVFGNTASSLEEVNDGSDRYVRVRVDIDVSKPLLWSLPFCDVMLPLSYENLPKYCIFCGLIGHEEVHVTRSSLLGSMQVLYNTLKATASSILDGSKGRSEAKLISILDGSKGISILDGSEGRSEAELMPQIHNSIIRDKYTQKSCKFYIPSP